MTTFTEQALDHFENLKAEGQATQSMVSEYLETMFKEKRVG